MRRDADAIVALRRALGQRLATFRQAVGLTQGQLAAQVHCERSTVAHLERGRGNGTVEFWRAADTALDAGGALVRGHDELLAAQDRVRDTALAEARARADAYGNTALDGCVTGRADRGGVALLNLAAAQAMSEAFQVVDRKVGGGVLYGQVVRYIRAEIAPALLDPPRNVSTSELFSAAASFAEVAGWMAHDSGRDEKAQAHFGHAYRLAAAAGNAVLSANICASLAHLAVQLGHAADAVRISTAGLSNTTRLDSAGHLVARLGAMQARAFALTGSEKRCRAALDTARATLDNAVGSPNVGWIAGFDRASLAAEAALCFYTLGALAEAEAEARTVIALRVGDRVRSRALGQLTLANILTKVGEPAEAAAIGAEICTTAAGLDSARVRTGLRVLGKRLTAHSAIPTVNAFLENLASTQTGPQSDSAPRWPL